MSLFCAVAIDRNDEEKRDIIRTDNERDGLFVYNDSEKKKIRYMNSRSNKSEQEKRIEVISYLFKLAYDLAISDQHNVSESAGFESCIGGC